MKLRVLPLALLCSATFSCDKAKNLVNQAKSAVEKQAAANSNGAPGPQADPALQKLVDQTPEGVIFRKDLPFPSQLEVKVTRRHELAGRFFEASAIETRAQTIKGTQTTITKLERAGDQVRYTLLESTFTEPVLDPTDKSKKPTVRQLAPPSKPLVFQKSAAAWKADASEGFRAVALSRQLSPVFDQLLVENALAPRSLWFGKRRFQIGDSLAVADNALPMLLTGDSKGSFKLTLESIAEVNGHPCGVFTVTGDFSRKQFPDFEGNLTDDEVTIQSGKLWLSLLYPLILREEIDTVQSYKSGGHGGLAISGQGSVKVSVTREWKNTGR